MHISPNRPAKRVIEDWGHDRTTLYTVLLDYIQVPVWDIWRSHPKRAIKLYTICNPVPDKMPGCAYLDELNMWTGFHYDRDSVLKCKNWKLMLPIFNHIRYTWCDNEAEVVNVLSRLAMLLQMPWRKQEVCVSLAGEMGSGKGFILKDLMGKIIGDQHFLQSLSARDFTDPFNAHLANRILLFADELPTLSGHEIHTNIIKCMITEPKQLVRHMYEEPRYQKSYLNIWTSTNEIDAAAPITSTKDRRFFILYSNLSAFLNHEYNHLTCGSDEREYWRMMHRHIEENDDEAVKTFANFLYNVPLGDFEPRKIPTTMIQLMHKLQSTKGVQKWWINCLLDSPGCPNNFIFDYHESMYNILKHYANFMYPLEGGGESGLLGHASARSNWVLTQQVGVNNTIEKSKFIGEWKTMLPSSVKFVEDVQTKQVNIVHFPTVHHLVQHMCQWFPGFIEMVSAKSKGYKGVREERLAKCKKNDMIDNWAPRDFNGTDLQTKFMDDTFRVYNSAQWETTLSTGMEEDRRPRLMDAIVQARSDHSSN